MNEQTLQEMIGRHYRDEWGNCGYCQTTDGYDTSSADWPCDAAALLQSMGYTLHEEPLYVAPPRDPRDPNDPQYFFPEIWSETVFQSIEATSVFSDLVNGTIINIPQIRSLEIRA